MAYLMTYVGYTRLQYTYHTTVADFILVCEQGVNPFLLPTTPTPWLSHTTTAFTDLSQLFPFPQDQITRSHQRVCVSKTLNIPVSPDPIKNQHNLWPY